MKTLISAALLVASITACTVTSDKPGGTAADSAAEAVTPAPVAVGPDPAPAPAPAPVDSSKPPATSWVVTSSGIGNLKVGMSVADLKKNFGDSLVVPAELSECVYIRPRNRPAGVFFMMQDGKLARVDIRNTTAIKTSEGAGIGDTEDRIKSLYPGRVTVTPHKYTDGHYLVVAPGGSPSNERIVFETDGKKVTQFQAGRTPNVEYVEGCS